MESLAARHNGGFTLKFAYPLMAVIALAALPGCGSPDGGWCGDVCDCTGDCSPNDLDDCEYRFEDAEKNAEKEDCEDRFDDAVDCLNDELVCRNGDADLNAERCADELDRLIRCTGVRLIL
jgi:hypothetical protein